MPLRTKGDTEMKNYNPLIATNKQVRYFAKIYGVEVKWYDYILPNLLRKRLLIELNGRL